MRPHVNWLLTAALALAVTAPAFGQLPLGTLPMLENGLDTPILLSNRGVQREIKLTEQQYGKVRKIDQQVQDKYRPQFAKARNARDNAKSLKVAADFAQERRDRLNRALPDILKPEQAKRLKEIRIQVNGLISLNKSEVQKDLKLTDKQKEEFKDIQDNLRNDIAGVVKDAMASPGQRPLEKLLKAGEVVRKIKGLNEGATQKALAKLTEEQTKTWRDMTGEKFDFNFIEMPNRPGGGR